MGDRREYWANVYASNGKCWAGCDHPTAERAGKYAALVAASEYPNPRFRIHVRLKPEGAPRRYASKANRVAWESFGSIARDLVRDGADPTKIRGAL